MTRPEKRRAWRLRTRLRVIIFGTDTPAGRTFDVALLMLILASMANLMLVSVAAVETHAGSLLRGLEWLFTLLFSIEYAARIYAADRRLRYVFSFYGLIDLVSILPLYLGFELADAEYLVAIRILRVMRIFRVLKLVRYTNDAGILLRSLLQAQRKLQIFLGMLALVATVLGALMYVVEGPEHGFTSIPKSIYWAIVTITTVGYGDIAPVTATGQTIAGIAIMLGYALLAVTAGIITAELTHEVSRERQARQCGHCRRGGHELDARFCKFCGNRLFESDTADNNPAQPSDRPDRTRHDPPPGTT